MRRSLFECDSYERIFRPLIKDSTIYIDGLGKQRENKKIIQAINACSNSSGTSIYARDASREKGITAKRNEQVSSSQEEEQHINVESLSQKTGDKNVAFQSLPQRTADLDLDSKTRSSDSKFCQQDNPQAYKGVWKRVDPENLIKIEPTRYYVLLPPIRKSPEEKSKTVDMRHGSNVEKKLKNTAIESLTSRKGVLKSEWPKLPKCSITTKTMVKPTDLDIMFGHKRRAFTKNHDFNGSRIDWMLDLERKQELRKKRQQLWKATIQEENNMDLCCFPFIRNVFVWHF